MGAVVADAGLVPGPGPRLLDDAELVWRQHARPGAFLGIAAQDPATGPTWIEAEEPAVVLLHELDVAAPPGADEVAAHGFEGDVQVPVERLLVRRDAHVERHVALLEVGLHDRPVAGLQGRLAEAPDHEREDPGHQVGGSIVQLPPVLADPIELDDGGIHREVVAPHTVGQPTGPQAKRFPAGLALERRAIRIGHQQVESFDLHGEVVRRDALADEPVPESGRPHLVDDVHDLGLFHEVVDELRGVLTAVGGQAKGVAASPELLLDLDHGRDGLISPVAGAHPLADAVRPLQVGDHCALLVALDRGVPDAWVIGRRGAPDRWGGRPGR